MTTGFRVLARQLAPLSGAATGAVLVAAASLVVAAFGASGVRSSIPRGWLIGFLIWSSVPVGSMTLLMVHRLTGGKWGHAAAPVLKPAAALMPFLLIAILPVLISLHSIYPWAADPAPVKADVSRWYLSSSWFVLRSLVTLIGWSTFGVLFALGAGGQLLAALGLTFLGLTVSLVSVDWYLSVEPAYVASAFPAMIAVENVLAALAAVAALRARTMRPEMLGDLGGLLIAALLGVVYLGYMTFVVAWYGDLPDKAEWFIRRLSSPWLVTVVAALCLGAIVPFGMLMVKAVRTSAQGLHIASTLVLTGIALNVAWLVVPAFAQQAETALFAVLTLLVLSLSSAASARALHTSLERAHAK